MVQAIIPVSQIEPLFDVRLEPALGAHQLSNQIEHPGYDDDNTGILLEQALSLLAAAERRLGAQREHIAQLQQLALIDPLTGLPNRRAFDEFFYAVLAATRRYDETGVLAFIDIDNFRTANDSLGHEAGDAVLMRVAEILSRQVRANDMVARYGGDEFGALLVRTPSEEEKRRATELQNIINTSHSTFESTCIHVHASFGVVAYGASDAPELVIQHADAEMFANRQANKNRNDRSRAVAQLATP